MPKPPTPTIRAITLDLDDTLWPAAPTIWRAELAAHDWLAARAPQVTAAWPLERQREHRKALYQARPELRHDFLAIRRAALHTAFRDAGIAQAQAAPIVEGSLEVFMEARNQVQLYPDVLGSLERLSSRYRIAALSNGNADIARIGIGRFFHTAVAAHTYARCKPDATLFHIACRELGCAPGEVVHLGDDIELDVRGALGAGLHAVWINRAGAAWPSDDPPPVMVRDLDAFEDWLEGA